MNRLYYRTFIAVVVLTLATVSFLPNFLERDLVVTFRDYYRGVDDQRIENDPEQIQAFIHDEGVGLKSIFPDAECRPQANEMYSAEYRCILSGRFITAAKVNEVVQSRPDLIDDLRTGVLPHGIEKAFSFLGGEEAGFKPLTIKLGLDLQGGMRAIFQADYETYLDRLQERFIPARAEINSQLEQSGLTDRQRRDLENRLSEIDDMLALSEERRIDLLDEARRIIERRLVAQNLTEPEVRIQPGSYSISVDMPGVANSSEVLQRIRDTVTVEYRFVNSEATDRLNTAEYHDDLIRIQNMYRENRVDEIEINEILADVAEKANISEQEGRIFLYWRRGRAQDSENLPREYRVLEPPILDGDDMTNAQESVQADSPFYQVNFTLSGAGATKFGDATTENVGRNMAIVWGDRVVSDPVIRGPIVGGSGVITGQFSQDEARELSNVIREGALPLPLEVLSVTNVGPTLGQESIEAGVLSVIVGFILVNIFVVLYYRLVGLVAVMALFINLILMGAILSLLEFTLTLPGFAGIILTVGMAVDANVIIFEKMKEDIRLNKPAGTAIESGFQASMWTILDANVTTLLAAIILYYTGDGPIRGFAITLFFGLLSSMFTALYMSRIIFDWSMLLFKVKKLYIGKGIRIPEPV